MTVEVDTNAVTAAALARLHDYLRRAPDRTEEEETIARDAFVAGFHYGARWTLRQTTALADPRFRECVAIIAELMHAEVPEP